MTGLRRLAPVVRLVDPINNKTEITSTDCPYRFSVSEAGPCQATKDKGLMLDFVLIGPV